MVREEEKTMFCSVFLDEFKEVRLIDDFRLSDDDPSI